LKKLSATCFHRTKVKILFQRIRDEYSPNADFNQAIENQINTGRASISSKGIAPQTLESSVKSLLSPKAKKWPGGTIAGPKLKLASIASGLEF
jgi:hypothetical protein